MSRKNNDGFCGNKNKTKNNDDFGGNIWNRPGTSHNPPPPHYPPDPAKPTIIDRIWNTKSKLRDVTYATIVKQLLIKRTYCNYWTPVLETGLRLKIVTMLSYLSIVACMGLLLAVYDSSFCHSLSSTSLSRADGLQHRLKQLTADGGMILLDGDNVRGKTKFQLSKEG